MILAYFQETYNSQKKKKKGSYSSEKNDLRVYIIIPLYLLLGNV